MSIILPGIDTLAQHINEMNINPGQYKPDCCPHCGSKKLHCHGVYLRHPDRTGCSKESSDPILIPRFLCVYDQCGKSCSVLPQCIPPRRWYLWSVQQCMLALLLTHQLSDNQNKPHSRTVWRWWARLKECFDIHRFHLCESDISLGQYRHAATFWGTCLIKHALSRVMLFLHLRDVYIP